MSLIFSGLAEDMHFGKRSTEVKCVLLGASSGDVALLLDFSPCRVTTFPIEINTYLEEDPLRLGNYPVSP